MTTPSQGSGGVGADDPGALAPLIDAAEAAELLAVPETWVRSQVRARRIPCVRLGKYIRFDAATLREWALDQQDHGRGAR